MRRPILIARAALRVFGLALLLAATSAAAQDKTQDALAPLVSVEWLAQHLREPGLVALEASQHVERARHHLDDITLAGIASERTLPA